MIMRWIGIILALSIPGLLTWGGGKPDLGIRTERAMDTLLVRSALAEDFRQRHADHGVECTACHGDGSDFSTAPTTLQCVTCHGSHDAVAARTADVIPNPHHSHMGDEACSDCHSEHRTSRLSCNQCHVFEMDVP